MQRNRAYFFDTPRTTAGAKLNAQNIPSEVTFRDLLDSITFKSESSDYASETTQGLVKLASIAISKARSGTGVVLPNQLPVIEVDGTELLTGYASCQGIKVTAISAYNRLNYQIDFDPTSLTAKTPPAVAGDYVVIVDSADSNKPKKILLSGLAGVGSVWQDIATVISPVTAGDSLDMSGATVTADGFLLKAAATTYINPKQYTGNNGASLQVAAGAGQHASDAKNGGNLYLIGGSHANAGNDGNVVICYNGSSGIGKLGIGCNADTAYLVKVCGDGWITGKVKLGVSVGGGGVIDPGTGAPVVVDSTGVVLSPTFKQLMDAIVGATVTAKSAVWFDGTKYNVLSLGSSADKYLRVNSSLNLEAGDLVLTGKVVDASFAATGIVAWNRMVALTASVVPVLDASGVMIASGTSSTALGYIANLTSDAQAQLTAVQKNVITSGFISTNTILTAATLKAQETIQTAGGSVTVTLPLISTLQDGQVVEFFQTGANAAILAKNAGDAGFGDKTGVNQTSLTMSGASGYCKLRADAGQTRWYVIAWI